MTCFNPALAKKRKILSALRPKETKTSLMQLKILFYVKTLNSKKVFGNLLFSNCDS